MKGVCIGAGYFSVFQYEAWNRIPEVEITAFCNNNRERAAHIQKEYGVTKHYNDWRTMLDEEKPDFVDIITPPDTHLEMCQYAAERGIHIICQKPLAPSFEDAQKIVSVAEEHGIRFMVHENWRFQPWYREIKKLLNDKIIGEVHSVYFRKRMGDGWGGNAYIPRQPYFRDYPKLIVYENGIHFIDTFRFLFGEVTNLYAKLRKLNPVIAGEDWAMIQFEFDSGINAVWDANRYNEPNYENPRYTFGEMLIDGLGGSIRLYPDGRLTIQILGKKEMEHSYDPPVINFSGDCVYQTQKHFVDRLLSGDKFETNGSDYLKNLKIQDAVYQSAKERREINL